MMTIIMVVSNIVMGTVYIMDWDPWILIIRRTKVGKIQNGSL